jgi:hypothetical protein
VEQQDTSRQQYITRSGRVSKAPERLGMTTYESILEPYDYEEWDEWCEKDLFAFKASEQVSMKASTDPDTMYYHQAMREPDKKMFKEAIRKECEDHFRESNYKRWATIRFFLTLAVINNWHTRQLDFLLAITQADIERDLYMRLPAGFVVPGKTLSDEDRKKYVLKLEKNLYGQKQAGRVWYQHLKRNLLKLGFKTSNIDECVFYYGRTIIIVYTDDTILIGPDKVKIDELIEKLEKVFKI